MEVANESSSLSPICHSTNPPGTDRHAEPLPMRARRESSRSVSCRPAAALAARLRAANADAEDASPAPAGKIVFTLHAGEIGKTCQATHPIEQEAHAVAIPAFDR